MPELPALRDIFFDPHYFYIRQALVVSALASVSFGLVGTFVVVRRIGYLTGAIAHCAFGGIGIGLFLKSTDRFAGVDPLLVALLMSIACAMLIGFLARFAGERVDTVIGAIWAVGMAVGLICLEKAPGSANISSYLFGDILLLSESNLGSVALLAACVATLILLFFRRFEAVSFDEEQARLRGIPAFFYFQALLVLTTVTVVILMQMVGIILVVAMLTLPAAAAGRLTHRLFSMALLSVAFCFLFSWIGLYLSLWWNLPTGPTIIVTAAVGYTLSLLVGRGR